LIGSQWTKKQVELALERVPDRFKAARARSLELARVAALQANILYDRARPMILFNQIGAAFDGKRRRLSGLRPVIDGSDLNGNVECKRLKLKIDDGNQHKQASRVRVGSLFRVRACGGAVKCLPKHERLDGIPAFPRQ